MGFGSSRMGVADHGEGPVLRSCCGSGERLNIELHWPAGRSGGRWNGKSTADAVREGHADTLSVAAPQGFFRRPDR
jgi:hypothetical protein